MKRASFCFALAALAATAFAGPPRIVGHETFNVATGEITKDAAVDNAVIMAGYSATTYTEIQAPFPGYANQSVGDDAQLSVSAVGSVLEGLDFTIAIQDLSDPDYVNLTAIDVVVDVYDATGFDINTSTPLFSTTYEYRADDAGLIEGDAMLVSITGAETENVILPSTVIVNFTYQNAVGGAGYFGAVYGYLAADEATRGFSSDLLYWDGVADPSPFGGSPYGNLGMRIYYVDEARDIAYQNTTEPVDGYGAVGTAPDRYLGDVLTLAAGGTLDSFAYTVVNYGEDATTPVAQLESADVEIQFLDFSNFSNVYGTLYDTIDYTGNRLPPGMLRFRVLEDLATEGVVLPAGSEVLVRIMFSNPVFKNSTGVIVAGGDLGQALTDPPTVGSSDDYFYEGIDGADGLYWFFGDPVANLFYEIVVTDAVAAPVATYSNTDTADGSLTGFPIATGAWMGDDMVLAFGGTLEAISLSVGNFDDGSNPDLTNVSLAIELYDLGADAVIATLNESLDFSSNPVGGMTVVYRRIAGLADKYGVTLDARDIRLSVRVTGKTGGGDLGQVFFHPPTVGNSSYLGFYIDDTVIGGSDQGYFTVGGKGNLYFGVEVMNEFALPTEVVTVPDIDGLYATFQTSAADINGVGGTGVDLTTYQELTYPIGDGVDFTYGAAPAGHVKLGWVFRSPTYGVSPLRVSGSTASGVLAANVLQAEAVYSTFVDYKATRNGSPVDVLFTIDTLDRNGDEGGQTGTTGFTRHYDPLDFNDATYPSLAVGVTAPAPQTGETLTWLLERHDGTVIEVEDAGDGQALVDGFFPRTVAKVTAAYGSPYQKGDMDCDGLLTAFDIDPFVLALVSPTNYALAHPDCDYMLADVNNDGAVNAFDIDPFVLALVSGS